MWVPFERQEIEVYIFERAKLSDFATREFIAKEDLNPRKQVFLLHLRLWPTQRPETKDLFYFLW